MSCAKPIEPEALLAYWLGELAPAAEASFRAVEIPNTTVTFNGRGGLIESMTIAGYAAGVGPNKDLIVPRDATGRLRTPTTLIRDAHRARLVVHGPASAGHEAAHKRALETLVRELALAERVQLEGGVIATGLALTLRQAGDHPAPDAGVPNAPGQHGAERHDGEPVERAGHASRRCRGLEQAAGERSHTGEDGQGNEGG